MNTEHRIVIATPHARYDAVEAALRARPGYVVLRLRAQGDLTPEALRAFAPSHVFFPHWSWKIPAAVHDAFECVIFHMTDVPFGRGGSPLQNLIVRGFEQTQLSALRCTAALDAGPVYLKRPLSLHGTAEDILVRAAQLMPAMVEAIVEQRLQPVPQSGEPVLFARRTPEDGDLREASTLAQVYDRIRMLDAEGYPRAFLQVGRIRIEFSGAQPQQDAVVAQARITLADQENG